MTLEKSKYLDTQFHMIRGVIADFESKKTDFKGLVVYFEKLVEDIKKHDVSIANTLYNYWLDLYIINKTYLLRLKPELTEDENEKISQTFGDITDYINNYVRLDLIDEFGFNKHFIEDLAYDSDGDE